MEQVSEWSVSIVITRSYDSVTLNIIYLKIIHQYHFHVE